MKCARRWAIVGLLCLCGVFGCTQLPTRGLFARRIKPPTDESHDDERFDRIDDSKDNDQLNADRNHDFSPASRQERNTVSAVDSKRRDAEPVSLQLDLPPPDSTGETSELWNSERSTAVASIVEAPAPHRRSLSPPATFVAAPNAREITPNSNSNSNNISLDQDSVTYATHESQNRETSNNIELTAGQRSPNLNATGTPNPWDRFRGLATSLNQASGPQSADQSRVNGAASIDGSAPANSIAKGVTQPPPWSGAYSQEERNNSNSATHIPEPWQRAPVNWNTTPNARVDAYSSNVRQMNADQPGSVNFPAAVPTPQLPRSTGNLPFNSGSPDAAPLAVVRFASSPELERLITQTTVEAAAVLPGDNDVNRQLSLRKHVQLRILYLISGQTDRALQPIPGIDSVDQEFWQQMMWGLANYFDTQGMPDSAERATQTISQLRIAAARLQEKARLELHNVAFCHKISGFGNYQRFKRDEFTPGQPVLLYAEVAEFMSEPTPDGQFRTLMKSTLEISEAGPNGKLVESLPLAPSEDRCRNQRRDYYHSYEFAIPQGCNAGPHTLQLRVEDQLGKKSAVTKLNFTVQ